MMSSPKVTDLTQDEHAVEMFNALKPARLAAINYLRTQLELGTADEDWLFQAAFILLNTTPFLHNHEPEFTESESEN